MKNFLIISILTLSITTNCYAQGPYAPPVGQNGSTAIFKDDAAFVGWATNAIITRGWQNIADTTLGKTTAGNDTSATNKAGINGVVSLGDGGIATLTFNGEIYNGAGADFAVFENSFDGLFLELAFVEVSSDGINFFRFNNVSLTDTTNQINTFGLLDATNLHNLAGKYKVQYGTPFDLNELSGIAGLDINHITHVRIIDVVGSLNNSFATYDSQNRKINDPYPTAFATGGFDLDAVGVINFNPVGINEVNKTIITQLYPNPVNNFLNVQLLNNQAKSYQIINLTGQVLLTKNINNIKFKIDLSSLKQGIYLLKINTKNNFIVKRIIKQ